MTDSAATPRQTNDRSLVAFTVASLITIAFGAVVMIMDGVPLSIWIRNPIAWVIAAGLSFALMRVFKLWTWMAPIALALVSLSLLGPEQEGVHRWLGAGPIQLNAAALVLPAAIAAFNRAPALLAAGCFALIAAVLAWQPDISQLVGFAFAAVILSTARFGWKGAALSLLMAAAAIAFCLTRPDPLEPVDHVENILFVAGTYSPVFAIAMAVSLAAAALSPFLFWRNTGRSAPALALGSYFFLTSLAFLFGAYPVPLAGYGLSFVIGWWLGIAALCVRPPHTAAMS